ncbi:SWIM zinc finger family protein [Bifidobacterium longum]|uniref:SWIM zinc finger family protein n=1 Tax=Bifidobacterium longum TaxID=216816 RepID=UPI0020249ABD|nr:SWIM zinc finger family protein [Bifidobacterium longum]
MTAHFDEFEEEMTSRSLERAYDYVDEHRIGGLEELSAGLFHAEVHGSELYDVDIRLRGNDIVFASCTCPYDYDGYCKHIGAVLLTLRDYKHGGNHQQNVTYDAMIAKQDDSRPDIPVAANPLASKPEVFNRVLQHIRERVGLRKSERWTPAQHFYLVWNQDEINAIVTANPAIASGMEPLMPESTVDRVMESPMRRHLGKDYGWKFKWGDAAINGVMAVFEEAEQSNDYPLAMRRMCAALRKTVWFARQVDDEEGALQTYIEHLNERILAYTYAAAPIVTGEQAQQMLIAALRFIRDTPMIEMLFWPHTLLECVIPFADIHARGTADVEQMEHQPREIGTTSFMCRTYAQSTLNVAQQFLHDKKGDSIDGHRTNLTDYDWDAAQKHAGYWELTAQLPHGELTMLEACYERLNDENGIKQLYEYYVAHSDSVADERCIPILKSMVGKSGWPQSVQNILRNYHEHDFGGKVLARLMTEEHLSDEALTLAGQRPELLRDLLKPISLNHSAEAERLIRKQLPLDRDLQQGNRNEYRFVAMWIEQYRNVFGLDQAKALAKEIMAKYPRRYALKEEIGRVLK